MRETQLTIVRHGETDWNVAGRIQGHLDSPLTANGIAQARLLGSRLAAERWDGRHSSDLGRARHTASFIGGGDSAGAAFSLDARLRERCLGIFQGLTYTEIEARHPELYRAWRTSSVGTQIPEAQGLLEHVDAAMDALEEIARRHEGGRVLIVTHGGLLAGLFRKVTGIPFGAPRRFSLLNAALNRFVLGPDGWRVEVWGDVSHLANGDSLEERAA